MNSEMLIQMLSQGQSPQQIVMSMIGNYAQTPFAQNLLSLAKNGDGKAIENIARNVMKENGRDFDTEFSNFRKKFGL